MCRTIPTLINVTKGIYVLAISIRKGIQLNVGALDRTSFEKGTSAYVGSSQNNLEKHVDRSSGNAKRVFWRIDYLFASEAVRILKVFRRGAKKSERCSIAGGLEKQGVAERPFGFSNCKCMSHPFRPNSCSISRELLQETTPHLDS